MNALPNHQYAVQLIGPGQLKLSKDKAVTQPTGHQILARVEVVGLCFSDLKLLKQFSDHARKSEVLEGLSANVLKDIPSYVPGSKPTVPGHEVTCRIVAIGEKVKHHQVGERCLVQTDYRDLPTAGSNSAFGYNFEGALQEYVLMDERVVMGQKDKERYLIPVPENISASALALVEPWACVEDSYVTVERQTIKPGGKLLVVAEAGRKIEGLPQVMSSGKPALLIYGAKDQAQKLAIESSGASCQAVSDPASLPNESFDDIIYFGSKKATLDLLNDKLASRGIMNVVLGGEKIGQAVSVGIGRVHYGLTRWIGTTGSNAAQSYQCIPATGELRPGDRTLVVGAGGPMGQMHVIRAVSSGIKGLSLVGTDMDDARLKSIGKKAQPLAKINGVNFRMVNTAKTELAEQFSYIALMVPIGALVAAAVKDSLPGALINIFAGIPAPTKQDMDLDTYISKGLFMFGTSGSTIHDMKIVLRKVISGQLDTNCSVDAVSGMAGATEGIAAVENRTLSGKILVYPQLHHLPLTPLKQLGERYPSVLAKLNDGIWTKEAEAELLRIAQ